MSYKLIIKKLNLEKDNVIVSDLIREYCNSLNMDYYSVIRYLTYNKYLIRIMRGIFYKPTIEERKLGKIEINYLEAISKALEIKGVKNWYFGMTSALKLNNLTHEFFNIDYVISDSIFRAKEFIILGHKVKFIKLKPSLIGFGIIKNKIPYSEPEKTILDMAYLSRYGGLSEKEIKNKVEPYLKYCSKDKLIKYSTKYNATIKRFVGELV